ncbi:MAG: DNA-directed RNA polymerase subunit alpha [Candidatus Nealsonbacteria bacterium]|nr:DNA-directed RNA polymerase subunit alpha [Candidatus Nealsonbacteria bacterium]
MIPLPLAPKVVKSEGNKAIFEVEALYPGYGITVGNALRRVLISSLEGAAITQVKIKNAPHEFATIPGVMEDVITILLNLKQLRFKVFADVPQKATLKIKGEKEVKGGDFEIPAQLELVNPDCHVATLTQKSAELEMEILVEKGIGYLPREERKKESETGVGVIPVDAIFTPIKRVGLKSENMRVGERTDFDKLSLSVETDGTLTPEEAFSRAAEILLTHFSFLTEAFQKKEEITEGGLPKEGKPRAEKKEKASKKQKNEKNKKRKKA